jgi:3-oxoacyl-[acyl-carrier protein] reductase
VQERRVLVTGASRGIGRAIALRLAKDGWRIAVHYGSNRKAAEDTAQALGESASGIYSCDLGEPSSVADLWQRVTADGPVHALVNNAGVYHQQSFLDCSEAEFDKNLSSTFAINWESPIRLTRCAAQTFASAGAGKILNVASRVGFRGEAGAAVYSASKAALINLTRALAVELAPNNVQVLGIAPGWVETAMVREGMKERLTTILESIPVGRMASPEDCGAAAAFLLSDEASYLSGVVIDINGASYFH